MKYLFFVFIALLLQCSSNQVIIETESPPNIILFLVDDLGWQDTSLPFWDRTTERNQLYNTPNMERLAAKGMKFTQAYATPVCSPTRISLMTGMNAARHRVTNWTLHRDKMQPMELDHTELDFPFWNVNGMTPDSTIPYAAYAKSFPQILRDNGYKTIHVGKAHLGAIGTPASDPLNIGFDVNIAGHAAGAPKSYLGVENFGNLPEYKGQPWVVPGLKEYHGKDIFLTEALTDKAIKSIRKPVSEGQPFFLYMALYGVHTPIMANRKYVQAYYDQGLDSVEARYASMIQSMDVALGALIDYTEESGIADNTIILFMSDNGGLSAVARGGTPHTHNLPLSSGKGSIHEGGIREPMIAYWPGHTKAGSTNDQYVIIEDFYPSILELAGVNTYDTPQEIDGKSFMHLLKGGMDDASDERPLYWHYPNSWGPTGPGIGSFSAIRKGDWKLIYYHDTESFELFNIEEDIGEEHNMADKKPRILGPLAMQLGDYLRSVDAQMPRHKQSKTRVLWPDEAIAQHVPVQNVYRVEMINEHINIDGWPDESVWKRAVKLEAFQYPWQSVVAPRTEFRALYDESYLYFSFLAIDDDVIAPEHLRDKDTNVLASDRVELFFRSDELRKPYYSLEMDSKGRIYDSEGIFYESVDGQWNYPSDDLIFKSKVVEDGYHVEGKISLASLRRLNVLKDSEILAGVYRGEYKHLSDGTVAVSWISWVIPPSERPDFHIPSSLGKMVLER